ncbi:MAG: CHAD domain-containing protein [Bacteroidetes bacterium]|nr:CHAD domain-containing protein [Bacteroidota bacterium]
MDILVAYLKRREDNISFLLNKPRGLFTSGTFHKLRVEIKKLNALFCLIKFCVRNFKKKKLFKPFRTVFRLAGKVREIQVEEAMLNKYFINNMVKPYRDRLIDLRIKKQKVFFRTLNKRFFKEIKKNFRKVYPCIENIKKEDVYGFLKNRQSGIRKITSRNPLEISQMHLLRKEIKMFNYNMKSLDLQSYSGQIPGADDLTELLGKWHDCQVISANLENAINSEGLNESELDRLENIRNRIILNGGILFEKINSLIPASGYFNLSENEFS